jgi:hypothetical protein
MRRGVRQPPKIRSDIIKIDPLSPAIAKALNKGDLYRKVGGLRARRVVATRIVVTVLADGTSETKNLAVPGDYISIGAAGEEYAVKAEIFKARYSPMPRKKGVYIPRGYVVAIRNPLRRPISIRAPWGEMQYGSANCVIADIFDPVTKQRAGQPYLIGHTEFNRTYLLVRASKALKRNNVR